VKLNQIISIEKSIKTKAYAEITELHKVCQKPDLFSGFAKSYAPKSEGGETFPPENKKVQFRVGDVLKRAANQLTELLDVTAAKDSANTAARADLIVDDKILLQAVPVTYLLFLEKQLNDLRTFVDKLPELEDSDSWDFDGSSGLHKTEAIKTHRTKKDIRPIVKYDATKEHPAQTELIQEDVVVGYWDTVKHSGGIEKPKKDTMLERVDKLVKAVKIAREEANSIPAEKVFVGEKIFSYVFTD
jgi:hypothetical protein